jgi:hypothetical protein
MGFVPEPDPVIEAYKKDVDVSLLRENLKLTPAERLEKFSRLYESVMRLRGAAKGQRKSGSTGLRQ